MKIKNQKPNFGIVILIVLLLTLLVFSSRKSSSKHESDKLINNESKPKLDLETISKIKITKNTIDLIEKETNQIHKDSICSIYILNELGVPTLYYVYNGKLDNREKNDDFFLRIYLKDLSKWKKESKDKFVLLDFKTNFEKVSIDGENHYIFKKPIISKHVDFDNIKYINTGRFKRGKGRSYILRNISLKNVDLNANVTTDLKTIVLSIKSNHFEKIKNKRLDALVNEILITDDEDFFKAKVSFNNQESIDAEIKLKGDLTDHLNDDRKWSFKIIVDGEKTINGLRKSSIQHPKVRSYLWEWLFNKAIKKSDLIGLKYEFVDASLNIVSKGSTETIPMGIMAFEEAFDKILIENNSRREGLILGFEEAYIWNDRDKQRDFNLPRSAQSKSIQAIENSPIKVYNEGKVLSDPKLKKQFNIAKDLIDGLRNKEIKVSEAFDIDKLTMFVALTNLFGGYHGLSQRNLRIYYNPVTNKLEPISWDSYSGNKINKIHHYSLTKGDELYNQKLVEKLELVSSTEFINELSNSFFDELNSLNNRLKQEFGKKSYLDYSVLEHNSNFIKKNIFPSNVILSSHITHDNDEISLYIKNLSDFPVAINRLVHIDGKSLSKQTDNLIIYPNEKKEVAFTLKRSFVNAFVSKKNKKGDFRYPKDLTKIRVAYNTLGQNIERKETIFPFSKSKTLASNIKNYQNSFRPNHSERDFILINKKTKRVRFKKGDFVLDSTIIIPSGYEVIVEKGFNLDLKNNASIISYSNFTCVGSKEELIKFYSSDSTGAGLFISGPKNKSVFRNCVFSNLSNPNSDIWELSGSVNFNETEVDISHSTFENNRCEDGLNIIRSTFTMKSCRFENTKSDAFDGDFVVGNIRNCEFINSGNDGIDVSGSKITINDITFMNPSDKAISAGEGSQIKGSKINIDGGEIGIVSKDLSDIILSDVIISNLRLGLSSFQKKSEFGPGTIVIDNMTLNNIDVDYLIEDKSKLIIDNVLVETVSNNVINQMYGNEYGKSSK